MLVSPYLAKPLRTVDEVMREQETAQRQRLFQAEGHVLLQPEPDRVVRASRSSRAEDGVRRGPRASVE
jgi:hypothetical protein